MYNEWFIVKVYAPSTSLSVFFMVGVCMPSVLHVLLCEARLS